MERQITTEQSLEIIGRMIADTRRNFNDRGGAMFLIWGYTTIAVTLAITALYYIFRSGSVMWVWAALPFIGGVLTWLHFRRHFPTVQTHLDKAVWSVWAVMGGAAICCMIASYTSSIVGGKSYIDILFSIGLMMSMGTAITGRLIKYHPVEFGGFIGMGLAFALPAVAPSIWQLPLFAAIFLVAQVIPGHMLNASCKREARKAGAVQNGRAV